MPTKSKRQPVTKTVYHKGHRDTYAFKLDGVDPGFFNKPFGRQLDDLHKIRKFKETANSYHVGAKHRATLAAVKEWIADKQPDQFYAQWMSDSSTYKDDSVQVWYTGGVSFSDTTGGSTTPEA